MLNKQITEIFREVAKILELKGESIFKIRAYEKAAMNIESMDKDIIDFANKNRLEELPGIGKDLAKKIEEIICLGKLKFLEELKKTIPAGLLQMLDIPGLGPKKVKLFYDKLKIKDIPELEEKIHNKKLLSLPGIKEKTLTNILQGIEIFKQGKEQMPLLAAINAMQEDDSLELIKLKDICGDLHVHSRWSDGENSIEDLAQAAKKLGYKYIASTDHSKSLKIARGLSINDLKKKKDEIEKLNKNSKDFKIIFGTEANIDSYGKMDYPDKILKEFDIVIAAIHTGFKQSKEQLTKRIISACKNKYVNIIAHPTGRVWGQRQAYDLDFDQILKICKETNTALEISSFPNRLDLTDINAKMAKEKGVRLAIGSDSHNFNQLVSMKFGVMVARRACLEKKDVLNTLELPELLKRIKK